MKNPYRSNYHRRPYGPAAVREARRRGAGLLLFVVAVFLAVWLTGCGTVTPKTVAPATASFDGGTNTSGFLGYSSGTNCTDPVLTQNVPKSFNWGVITPHGLERYNALCRTYGTNFTVTVYAGDGVLARCGNYSIDLQHLVYFEQMNLWRKNGK